MTSNSKIDPLLNLGLAPDVEAFGRMELVNISNEVVKDKDGEPGWIEFWGPEHHKLKQYSQELRVDAILEQKREQQRRKRISRADAAAEMDKLEQQLVEGLALRVKDWRIVSNDGDVVDTDANFEKAKMLFGHYQFLAMEAAAYCADNGNFFETSSTNSLGSEEQSSEKE